MFAQGRSWCVLVAACLALCAACEPSQVTRKSQFEGGSGLVLAALEPRQVEALVLAGKVWGFLKYHHPAITAGQYQWDDELLRRLPSLLEAGDATAVRKNLVEWIDGLGVVDACRYCATLAAEGRQLAPRLAWIRDRGLLGEELAARLERVHLNRVSGQQHYVSLALGVLNPVFDVEGKYSEVKFPDSGFQILSIYRYWNIVEYWFPYRELIDEPWDEVLRDSLRRGAIGLSTADFQRELMALVARTDDGHANLKGAREPAGSCQLPVNLRFLEGQFVVEGLAADTGLARQFKPGDVVTALDGVPVEDIVNRVRRYYGASNEVARMRDIARALTRGACGPVKVGLRRDVESTIDSERVDSKSLDLAMLNVNDRPGETLQLLAPDIAYLKLSAIKAAEVAGHIEKVRSVKNLVVDIRNYPAEVVTDELGSLLVDRETPFALLSNADMSNPGAFHFWSPVTLRPSAPHYPGRVFILVDEITQSRAEYTAIALRASPRASVIGSRTAGADGNFSPVPLPGGMQTGISGLGVFYPDKRPTQQVGVAIDHVCGNTIDGVRAGRDETLDCVRHPLAMPR